MRQPQYIYLTYWSKVSIFLLVSGIIFSACGASLSETALQTAVSEAIMTSSAEDSIQLDSTDDVISIVEDMVSKEEMENIQSLLESARIDLTQQAETINILQAELEQIYPLLTPTITIELPTPTGTAEIAATPTPSATQTGGLLFNQKYVITTNSIPVYTYDDENDAGFPIMYKTEPIRKFDAGDKIIVNIYPVRADGGLYFYLVIGPQHGGYYILVNDVQDYAG